MKILNWQDVMDSINRRKRPVGHKVTVHKRTGQHKKKPVVSIILLDWECRERFFSLDWLSKQDTPRHDYEIIWVELYNRVVPEVMEKADTVLTCGQGGMYHKHIGYNAGLLHSTGDVICVCDSDAVFPPDFVSSIINSFTVSDSGGLKPMVLMHHEWRTSFEYPECLNSIEDVKNNEKWKWWPLNPNVGACVSMRREDVIRFGGFDEHKSYRGYLCGAYDLGWRLVNAGLPEVWYDADSVAIWHFAHPDPVGVNGVKSTIKNIMEIINCHPHVDLHAITAVEAFSTGRMLPLKENPDIFRIRMQNRRIGTEFEVKYAEMSGLEGFPRLLLLRMRVELIAGLLFKVIKDNLLKPVIKVVIRVIFGKKIYEKLRNVIDRSDHPEIITSLYGYNIVHFRGIFYGIAQHLGPVDFYNKKQIKNNNILKGKTIEEVTRFIKIQDTKVNRRNVYTQSD